jgi:hypothetical protein
LDTDRSCFDERPFHQARLATSRKARFWSSSNCWPYGNLEFPRNSSNIGVFAIVELMEGLLYMSFDLGIRLRHFGMVVVLMTIG